METYDKKFYLDQKDGSYASAKLVIPAVRRFVNPRTVIDVGCGLGTWLSVWKEEGAEAVVGVDGDYVDRDMLYIPKECFVPVDLAKDNVTCDRRVDLVMSLEVAEHLPADRAEAFVRNLTELSDIVLFSAAIPYQGGTNHINEQWQSYWAGIFAEQGYAPVDCIRPQVWGVEGIVLCYAQNTLLYARVDRIARYPFLMEYWLNHRDSLKLDVVHPAAWQLTMQHLKRQGE